ncbi:hypothetical protein J591_0543 [Acinetobacter baumannii 532279]|nr:hypothetical protein J591_0543 [Acinetobacter baumannii 532279]
MFLNGVCRHERPSFEIFKKISFLNGVCRHELIPPNLQLHSVF